MMHETHRSEPCAGCSPHASHQTTGMCDSSLRLCTDRSFRTLDGMPGQGSRPCASNRWPLLQAVDSTATAPRSRRALVFRVVCNDRDAEATRKRRLDSEPLGPLPTRQSEDNVAVKDFVQF